MAAEKQEIARRIKERREDLWRSTGQYTQEYVADLLGLSRAAYTYWETGRSDISAPSLAKLADILRVPVSYFYGESDTGRSPLSAYDDDATAEDYAEAEALLQAFFDGRRKRRYAQE